MPLTVLMHSTTSLLHILVYAEKKKLLKSKTFHGIFISFATLWNSLREDSKGG